jgi:ubiquinone/menaquinone biosynthesis C-methylase UbiE
MLLSDEKLIWSPVVANSSMNRERNASGINSYEQEFGFRPEEFLQKRVADTGEANWLDLCCGKGNAAVQVADLLVREGLHEKVNILGIDLIDDFPPKDNSYPCLQFIAAPFADFSTLAKFDLITCVHGLHYMGDKLLALEKVASLLKENGLFIANLDLDNIVINKTPRKFSKPSFLKKHGFAWNGHKKIVRRTGFLKVHFNLMYEGADDTYGPNYTGQAAVASHYSFPEDV